MIYSVCFLISLMVLLFIMAYEKSVNVNIVLLVVVVSVSNGGFWALATSHNLKEAILGGNVSYSLGCFAPILTFFIICDMCQIRVPKLLSTGLYAIQIAIYMIICTTSEHNLFFDTVAMRSFGGMTYLVKTYGPLHLLYLFSIFMYVSAAIVAGLYAIGKKSVVNRLNVDIIFFVNLTTCGVYFIERFIHLSYELMPFFSTVSLIAVLVPVVKVFIYSVNYNKDLFEDEINKNGYIILKKDLRYMGCNDYARALFPELSQWTLEKKIPGNGGRFNTFLRQPLLAYIKDNKTEKSPNMTFSYKGEVYNYQIGTLLRNGRSIRGYYIQVSNVTDIVKYSEKKLG